METTELYRFNSCHFYSSDELNLKGRIILDTSMSTDAIAWYTILYVTRQRQGYMHPEKVEKIPDMVM